MTSQYLSSLFSLTSKTALITGGTRGIGHGLALALARAGADILLAARSPTAPHTLAAAEAIRATGRRCTVYACDLASPASTSALIPSIIAAEAAAPQILVLAGGTHSRRPALEYDDAEIERIWRVNSFAGLSISRDLAAAWKAEGPVKEGEGNRKIVNVASVLSFVGGRELAAYAATKGAIAQTTKALANEWAADGVNVNAIAPGYIRTDLTRDLQENEEKSRAILERTPCGRWGETGDLAGCVVWLAGRGSEWVSGSVVNVDGGYLAR
ncbi:hypothetical protein EDC01DRAFT_757729 [Geopyxis carbonaria]|nr:hypothetical protein EDC01DRAFT_757729 [Geopyxis carbonaria]